MTYDRQTQDAIDDHPPVEVVYRWPDQGGPEDHEGQEGEQLPFRFREIIEALANRPRRVSKGEPRAEGGDEPVASYRFRHEEGEERNRQRGQLLKAVVHPPGAGAELHQLASNSSRIRSTTRRERTTPTSTSTTIWRLAISCKRRPSSLRSSTTPRIEKRCYLGNRCRRLCR